MTKIWALLAASLSETPILGLNVTDYAEGLEVYLDRVKTNATASSEPTIQSISFPTLDHALSRLYKASLAFDERAHHLAAAMLERVPWWKLWRRASLYKEVKEINVKYKMFERKFLYEGGLDGRPQFKHVVFAPGLWTGYSGATFPGLVESLEKSDLEGIQVSEISSYAVQWSSC